MKKLYTVLICELVIFVLFEAFISYLIIRNEAIKFEERILSDLPKKVTVNEWVDPSIAEANREKAVNDYIQYLKDKNAGLITEEPVTIDLGYVPGTYQYNQQKLKEEEEKRKAEQLEKEESLMSDLEALRASHEVEPGSVEDKFNKMGFDLEEEGRQNYEKYFKGILSSVSFEAYSDHVYYVYTYLPGEDPDSADIRPLDYDDIEYEKGVIEDFTGKRPEELTIIYLSSEGEVLYELTK